MKSGSSGSRGRTGNTRSSPRVGFGPNTWNNYDQKDLEKLVPWFQQECSVYYCQEEVGENGTPHLQFCFKTKRKRRQTELEELFEGKVHFEKPKDWDETVKYCTKEDTRSGNKWEFPVLYKPMPPIHEEFKAIERMLQESPDQRKIHWYVDEKGGLGKTEFTKYMLYTYPDLVDFSRSPKSADLLMGFTGKLMMIVDFTRSRICDTFAPWTALEEIKDGLVCDSKLKKQSRTVLSARPHVIVFANAGPNNLELTDDKWLIKYI